MLKKEITRLSKLKDIALLLLPFVKEGRKEVTDNQIEVRYNELGDILFIRFIPGEAITGDMLDDDSYIRYDAQGNVMSWEIMGISKELESVKKKTNDKKEKNGQEKKVKAKKSSTKHAVKAK
jgi:uncharacterized protein YuzE